MRATLSGGGTSSRENISFLFCGEICISETIPAGVWKGKLLAGEEYNRLNIPKWV